MIWLYMWLAFFTGIILTNFTPENHEKFGTGAIFLGSAILAAFVTGFVFALMGIFSCL